MSASTRSPVATLTEQRFSTLDWLFERKQDGVRTVVFGTPTS
jgi:hypothetical protein